MLGLFIDLFLRMIWAKVAFATVVRVTCLLCRKLVALVTSGTGTFGSIRIHTADTGVWPGGGIQLASL
jgi:hypothetical protein